MFRLKANDLSLRRFAQAEDGAVTVDFVVLTAAIVGLGVAATGVVRGGVGDLSQDVDDQLVSQVIQTAFVEPVGFVTKAPLARGWSEAVACLASPSGEVTCSGGASGTTEYYNMSDGTQWQKDTVQRNGVTTVTWRDGAGEEVAEADLPDLPDDLPTASWF